jgi:hypothetical protein
MITETIEVHEPNQNNIYHIPGVHNMQNTLCGFVDVVTDEHDYEDHPCNCEPCIDALKKTRKLRFPKDYWEKL